MSWLSLSGIGGNAFCGLWDLFFLHLFRRDFVVAVGVFVVAVRVFVVAGFVVAVGVFVVAGVVVVDLVAIGTSAIYVEMKLVLYYYCSDKHKHI